MFSLCAIAACEQCVSEIMRAVLVTSSVTLMYCQSIRHMPLGPRRGCPGDRDLPAAGEEAWVDTGDCVEAGLDLMLASQDMLYLQFYPVLTSFYLHVYYSVHMFILLSCSNPVSCNSFYERTFITKYGLFCFYDLYALFDWYWLHFYLMYLSEMTK